MLSTRDAYIACVSLHKSGVEWSVQTAKEVRIGLPVTEWMKDVCSDNLVDGEAVRWLIVVALCIRRT